ncbi:hypothetical protein ASA1KI_37870 [Opitutales bacterium ASA1]|nr:hypothetical protein ASA1KI_37870 [Opitutales bacterium ASA1]
MRRRCFALLLALVAACTRPHEVAAFSLFSPSWGDVIVVTDMTRAGRQVAPATPDAPVYYRGRTLGSKLGSIPGDREPDERRMGKFVADVLARQGYLPAVGTDREPSLYLVVQWGHLQPGYGDLYWFLGYNAADDIAAPSFPGMLGPEVFRRGFRTRENETILGTASRPIYGIIVTAFEYVSASTEKPIVYWQTRIGLPAQGKSMADALPAMVLAAGDSFGRETKAAVLKNIDLVRKGRVEEGELETLGIDEPSADAPRPDRR